MQCFMLNFHSIHVAFKLNTDQQTLVTNFFDKRKFFQLLAEVITHLSGVSGQITAQKLIYLSQCCCAADGMSAKSCSMGSCCKSFGNLFGSTDGTDRHAAAQSLGHGYDIRFDTIVHIGHYRTGSAPSGLYLIKKKKHSLLITEFSQSAEEFFCSRMYTAFALYRLYHDGNGVLCTGIFECFQIIVRRIGETVGHGSETNLASVARLSCSGHGTESTAMEAHLCCYNVIFIGTIFFDTVFTGHLDHSLIGLGTGVLVKDLVHTDGGTNLLCQQSLRNSVGIVKGVHNIIHLIFNCRYYFFVTVTGTVYGDTCVKVKISLSVFIVDVLVLGCLRQEIHTLIGFDHVFVNKSFNLVFSKACVFQFHR